VGAEAVSFLSGGRNTLLAAIFAVAAWLLHRAAAARDRPGLAVAGAASLLAGLLSKETALPVLLLVGAAEWPAWRAGDRAARRGALLRLAPFGLATLLWFLLRQRALAGAGAGAQGALLDGLGGRVADLAYLVPRALLTLAWPPASSPRYFVPDELAPLAWPLLAGWGAILAGLWWLLGRGRTAVTLFGLAWLGAFWLPVSGLVPFPGVPLADRYLYLPAVGLWLVLADQAVRVGRRLAPRGGPAVAARVAGASLLVALAAQSADIARAWAGDVPLFTRVLARYPEEAFGHHNLGTALLDQVGDLDAAERSFERALALDPAFPRLRTQLGYVRLRRGDAAGALAHYREALALDPRDAEALFNAAQASEQLADWAGALGYYARFLEVPSGELAGARPEAEERLRLLPLLLRR
jgi:tetratricopeptide (TPR) repeat protein